MLITIQIRYAVNVFFYDLRELKPVSEVSRKRDRLWVQLPLEEIKHLILSFSLLW